MKSTNTNNSTSAPIEYTNRSATANTKRSFSCWLVTRGFYQANLEQVYPSPQAKDQSAQFKLQILEENMNKVKGFRTNEGI